MKFVWKGRIPHKGYAYTLYSTYMRIYIYMYDKYIETSSSKGRFWGGGTIYIYICICLHTVSIGPQRGNLNGKTVLCRLRFRV